MKETTDYSGWLRSIATAVALFVPMLAMHCDTQSRIDTGKDEQRARMIVERRHNDSLHTALLERIEATLEKHISNSKHHEQ